jgi:hypothetical protein
MQSVAAFDAAGSAAAAEAASLPLAGGTVTGTIVAPNSRIPVNVANGANIYGDSVAAGTGATPSTLSWGSRFIATYTANTLGNNFGFAGSFTADVIDDGILRKTSTTTQATVAFNMPSYGAPLAFLENLENDANSGSSLTPSVQLASQKQDYAAIALLTSPLDQQIQASNSAWTCTGSTPDDFYGSINPGKILATGASCSTTITTAGSPIDLLYAIFSADTGTLQVSIDSELATDTITGGSTLVNAPASGVALQTLLGYTRSLALARFVPSGAGSHTVSIACVNGGTNGCQFQSIFTAPVAIPAYNAPTVIKLGVLRQQSDALSAETAGYDAMSQADCSQMFTDGFRCINSPVRAPFITPTNLAFMMSSTDTATTGAITRTDITATASSTTVVGAANFNASYIGKVAICTDGLTASTDLITSVANFSLSSPTHLVLASAPGVSGTLTCNFGTNSQVTAASTNPGLHPDNAGHDAILQGILSVAQPVTLTPAFNAPLVFNAGFTSTPPANREYNLNITGLTPGGSLTSAPTCLSLFPSEGTNFLYGLCMGFDLIKSADFTSVVAAQTKQIKFGNQEAVAYQNGSFRWNFVIDADANEGKGMTFNNGLDSYSLGTPIASAATILLNSKITHVTGTTAITTITVPTGSASLGTASTSPALTNFIGCVKLIPDGLWSTATGGNIALASTAVVGKVLEECFDGTSWFPSY